MLSPRDDDDDDSHLCIKCNATIVGIEEYIKHRKQRCGKKNDTKPDMPSIDPLEPTYSLGADVFFQSLELQSSVKKTSLSRLTPPISKQNDRKVLAIASTSRDLPRMSPLESNLRGEDWIGGHSLRIGTTEDNQTKLINAVASISSIKHDIPSSAYSIGPFNDFNIKGDDESDVSDDSEDDDEEPPPNYTGGKWRPASPDHDDWDTRDEEHTGGKWQPIMPDTIRDEDYDAPPPGHTKGKWVPGAHEKTQIMQTTIQTKGSVQYWCGPCNRRLGSRAVYDKHLMSSLHMRKVLPEHELEFAGHLNPIINVGDKRASRPSRFVNDSIYSQSKIKNKRKTAKVKSIIENKKKRKRKPYFIQCSGCKSRVRLQLMGKHLISHYHFRKATETKSSAYRQLILDNIDAIVHQSPFQCSPCKFYTNWLSNFMQHWFSEEHERKMSSMDGRQWCSFCKFECETSQEMLEHLSGIDHSEVIAVINRSMPIIIRKKTVIKCETCSREFRYNIEAKRHIQQTAHQIPDSATDDYQELHKCQHCNAKFKSSVTLAAHLKSSHKQKAHLCLVCSKTFESAAEARQHRQTSEHRVRRKEKMRERGLPTKDLSKKCQYCKEILKNILELKSHIKRVHPEKRKTCSMCGMSFTFSQEVTSHVRTKACRFQNPSTSTGHLQQPSSAISVLWNCSQCLFTTESQAECFFHEVLHFKPLKEIRIVGGKEKIVEKYSCPICSKNFPKHSLRHHLKQHTFERPFVCTICGANFTRQSSLVSHCKAEHETGNVAAKSAKKRKTQDFQCSKCDRTFGSKSALGRHANCCGVEERQCPHEDCSYVASNAEQLIRHRRAHGERFKHHKCTYCSFESDQASHLKRHVLCHRGVKPYACPYCKFVCGSLENLRKHILRSGRHPGLPIYNCDFCSYTDNMATNMRSHLISEHRYEAKTAMDIVKKLLMVKADAIL